MLTFNTELYLHIFTGWVAEIVFFFKVTVDNSIPGSIHMNTLDSLRHTSMYIQQCTVHTMYFEFFFISNVCFLSQTYTIIKLYNSKTNFNCKYAMIYEASRVRDVIFRVGNNYHDIEMKSALLFDRPRYCYLKI